MEEEDHQEQQGMEAAQQRGHRPSLLSPSFAKEIEDEVRGMQMDGSDVLARKLSM